MTLDGKKDSKYISRYINMERLVRANNQLYYFVMKWKENIKGRIADASVNKAKAAKEVVLLNIIDKTYRAFARSEKV